MQIAPLFPLTDDDKRHPQLFDCVTDLQRLGIMPGTKEYRLSQSLIGWKRAENGFATLAIWYDGNWCWLYDYERSCRVIHPGQAVTAYQASTEGRHFYPMEGHPALAPESP